MSNDAAQYLDVIGLYLCAISGDQEQFDNIARSIAKAVLDDYIARTNH